MEQCLDMTNLPSGSIAEIARRMAMEFDLRPELVESFRIHQAMQVHMGNRRCDTCRCDLSGHTLEECAARRYGKIGHLYKLKEKV